MAAAASISLSLHLRFRPPLPPPRTPPRHAPFSLLSPSLPAPCRLRVTPGRPSPSPWRPDVRARAGGTIGAPPALARPGGAVETDRLPSDVRDRAMEAVDHFGGRVTIGDVASRAGLQLAQAERALQALAADTEGFLEVSEDGEVLYVFPKDYRANLAGKSFRMRVEPLVDKAKQLGAYLVRVSFGTALIASIVLVYTTIIAILSSSSDEDSRGRRRRSYGSTVIIPTDMFWLQQAARARVANSRWRRRFLPVPARGPSPTAAAPGRGPSPTTSAPGSHPAKGLAPMASAASTAAAGAPLRLLSSSSKPFLPRPHRLTLSSPISFQRLTARSAASPSPSTTTTSPSGSGPGSVDPAQLPPALRDIVGLFQSVPDARTRYKQLLAYAARLPPMDPALKTDANRVRGCVSQVWVHAEPDEGDGGGRSVRFHADSDAQLTKGLAALLVLGLSGAPAADVARVPVEFIELLGIRQSLSPSRNSGLLNMLNLMKRKALEIAGGDSTTSQQSVQEVAEPRGVDEKEPEFAAFGVQEEERAEEAERRDDDDQLGEVPLDAEGNGAVSGGRKDRIRESLEKALSPVELEIEDISHLHKGHAGVAGSNGETHFNVRVVSKEFEGKSLLKRHRAVYDLLQEELKTGLHALSIDAKTPSEV